MAAGEFVPASEHLELAVAEPTLGWAPRGAHDLYVMLAGLAVQQRNPAALRRYVPLAEADARQYGHELYLGIVQGAQDVEKMLSGDYGGSEVHLRQALTRFEDLGTRWQSGRTHLELGWHAAARNDGQMALAAYVCDVESFVAIRAEPDAERARQLLAALPQTNHRVKLSQQADTYL